VVSRQQWTAAALAVLSDGKVDDRERQTARDSVAWSTASIVSWNGGYPRTENFCMRKSGDLSGGLGSLSWCSCVWKKRSGRSGAMRRSQQKGKEGLGDLGILGHELGQSF
jgi:hypothetical protein